MSLFAKFASVGGATSASRILGFVREALIAATLGAGPVADAFYAAFRFPNLFRRLFAEGAFNSAFVPLFAKELEGDGKEAAARFAGEVFSVLTLILAVLTVAAIAFMPFLVGTIIAPAFADTPDKFALTTDLTRIMFPYLAAMSLVAMLSGILNSLRRYFIAALAPVLLNVVLITVLLYVREAGTADFTVGYLLAGGVVVSGLLQLGLLVHELHRTGFSFRPRRPTFSPKVKRLLALALPAALTGGTVQINLVIGQIIASRQDGAIALLSYADRVYQLPLGVIGIAIGVVLLPELARALRAGDTRETASLQNKSLEFGLGLTVPAAIALMIIPTEIVTVLYERGAFTAETSRGVAAALGAFAIGLPAFVLIKVFQPAYFAREDMRTPLWFSIAALVINAAGSLALFPALGHVGIALATSLSGWANALMLGAFLWWRGDYRPAPATLVRLAKILACTAALAVMLLAYRQMFAGTFEEAGLLVRLAITGMLVALSIVLYFGLAVLTGAIERAALMRLVRRRRPAASP